MKNISKRITSLLTLAIFVFTALAFSPVALPSAQAADGYALGDLIAFEGATPNSYEDTTDAQTSKKLAMNGTDRISAEGDASYYFIFNNNARNTTSGNLRLSHSNTQNVIFKSKGSLLNITSTGNDNKSIAGQNFYSSSPDLYARFAIVDSQAGTGANLNTNSQKKTSPVMTYEFDIQYKNNFFDILGYVSTHLASSFSGRNIPAFRVDSAGNFYSTDPDSESMQSVGKLTLGTKHKISVVIKLTPASAANKYNYETTLYLDGVQIDNIVSTQTVDAKNAAFYGFEMDLKPWTVNTNYSPSAAGFTGTDEGWYGYGNSTSTKLALSNVAKLNEYTILDTDTAITDFKVYSGNMYGDVMRTAKALDQMQTVINSEEALPSGLGQADIEWISTNPSLIDVDEYGVVSIVDEQYYGYTIPVTLTALISDGTESTTKNVNIEVKRNTSTWSAQDYVDYDAIMPFSSISTQPQNAVATDITLPTESLGGCTLSWSISKSEAATLTENVLSFSPSSKEPSKVTLTMTVSRAGAESAEKKFDLTVVKASYSEDEVFKWKHNLETTAETPAEGIYGDKISFEDWSHIRLGYTWPFTDDAAGIVPIDVWKRPVMIVGPFDNAISGFEAQAICQMAGGKLATDYEFEASADGTSWDKIDAYYIKGPETKIPDGNAVWTVFEHMFRPSYIDTAKNYRYLKIKFSDASYVSEKYLAASALDSVAVYFDTDVTKAYKNLNFDDMSAEKIDKVNSNLTIPSAGTNGTSIEWTSSNPEVVRIDAAGGKAIVDENAFYGYSIPVTLTAKISKTPESETNGTAREKVFDLTVVRNTEGWQAQDYANYDVLYHDDKDHLTFDYFTDQPADMVATSIHLPKKLDGGGTFTWDVKDKLTGAPTNAAKIDNYVLSFTPQNESTTPLVLTVTSTKDGASASRSFDLNVVRGFSTNLLLSANVSSSTSGIRKALSRDVVTYWETADSDNSKTVDVEFAKPTVINSGLIVNASDSAASFRLEVSQDGTDWETAYQGALNSKLVREGYAFDDISCKYARFTFISPSPVKIATIELYNSIVTDDQAMDMSLDAITVPTTVSDDFILPTTGAHIGTITWTSNNPRVIAISGNKAIVTRVKNENQTAVLTATLTHAPYEARTRQFTVTVAGIVSAGGSSGGSFGGGASGGIVASKDYITPSQSGTAGATFADVPSDHWANEFITALTDAGIVSKDTNYRPSDLVTREEFVKLVIAALGGADAESESASFTDADSSAWYMPYISAAVAKGIVAGNADGSFGIGASITRQDAAVMLYRAMSDKRVIDNMLIFTDSHTVSPYASEAVSYLANERILNGYEDGSFRPFGNLTRAESAKIIYLLTTFAKEGYNAQ